MSGMRAREPGEVFGPRMTLFADMLSVGLATAAVCLPVVTIPAALSTACAVLRGAGEGRPATAGRYFAAPRSTAHAVDRAAGTVTTGRHTTAVARPTLSMSANRVIRGPKTSPGSRARIPLIP